MTIKQKGNQGKTRLNIEEKALAINLLAHGKTPYAVGKIMDRSKHTIKKFRDAPGTLEEIIRIRENLADKFEQMTETLLDSVDAEVIDKMGGYQRVIAAAASADKASMLRGMGSDKMRPVINIIIGDPTEKKTTTIDIEVDH